MNKATRLAIHIDGPDGENVAVLLAPLTMLKEDAVQVVKEALSAFPAIEHDPDEVVEHLVKHGFCKVENAVVDWK